MAQDLMKPIEQELTLLKPQFEEVLGRMGLSPERIVRTVMISIERNPALQDPQKASRQTIISAAMSAACLGLEVDGVTGQGYLIPYAGKCQFVTGYKSVTTIGARSGMAIRSGVVREGDNFYFDEAKGEVRPGRMLGKENDRRIIAAWCVGDHEHRPPVAVVMSIDQILAIRDNSPGYRSGRDSPWKNPQFFPAMCAKTAMRQLHRFVPMTADTRALHFAAAMDSAFEDRGLHATVHPDRGVVVEGDHSALPDRQEPTEVDWKKSEFVVLLADKSERVFPTIEQWQAFMLASIHKIKEPGTLAAFRARNGPVLAALGEKHSKAVRAVDMEFEKASGHV